MISVENDFFLNLKKAVKSNDDLAVQSIIVDETSTLIAQSRDKVLDLLDKVGIKTTNNPTNEEISGLIADNIKTKSKLQTGLAYLIAEQNDLLIDNSKKKNAESKEINIDNSKDAVISISKIISIMADNLESKDGTFKSLLTEKSNNKAPNYSAKVYNVDNQTKSSLGSAKKSKSKRKKRLLIGLGIIAVGTLIYYGNKQGWFKSKTQIN